MKAAVTAWNRAAMVVSDGEVLLDLGLEAKDDSTLKEAGERIESAEKEVAALEFQKMLSGPQDADGAFA